MSEPKTIKALDTPELELSTMNYIQRVMHPCGYVDYCFLDDVRNAMVVTMTPDHKAMHDILLNDKPIPTPILYKLSAYISHADEFQDGPVNEDFLLLATTGELPRHSVFTVDRTDPKCATWFYSERYQGSALGHIYNLTSNTLKISTYAGGKLFEEIIPSRTWKEITNQEEVAAFERDYADHGPLRDIIQKEDHND